MTQQQSEDALRELVEGMYEGDMEDVDMEAAMPEGLSCKLLPHQVVGVNWMKSREEGIKKGGILADDVSLQCINTGNFALLPNGQLTFCDVARWDLEKQSSPSH
jgi:hypothetical protein